jgi:sugar phosphate isomerase/epimerase
MRFGLSTHLFHGERLTAGHIEAVAAHGFDLIEVFATRTHFDYRDAGHADHLRTWVDAAGVTVGSMHAPICDRFTGGVWGRAFSNASSRAADRQEAVDETRAALDAARALGCATLVLHLGVPRGQPIPAGDNDPGALRRSLEALVAPAAAAGVRLALEVMPNDLSTPEAILDALERLELGDAGVCLDFGHANLLGPQRAAEAAETLSGHVITTHVHDNAGTHDDHLVPFEGAIDWIETLTAMWKVGYGGPLVFEVADRGDAAGVLARTVRARARLQAILEDLAAPMEFGA